MMICEELLYRKVDIQFVTTGADLPLIAEAWSNHDEDEARPLLQERICERLSKMKKPPRWTNRNPPEWVKEALSARTESKRNLLHAGYVASGDVDSGCSIYGWIRQRV